MFGGSTGEGEGSNATNVNVFRTPFRNATVLQATGLFNSRLNLLDADHLRVSSAFTPCRIIEASAGLEGPHTTQCQGGHAQSYAYLFRKRNDVLWDLGYTMLAILYYTSYIAIQISPPKTTWTRAAKRESPPRFPERLRLHLRLSRWCSWPFDSLIIAAPDGQRVRWYLCKVTHRFTIVLVYLGLRLIFFLRLSLCRGLSLTLSTNGG